MTVALLLVGLVAAGVGCGDDGPGEAERERLVDSLGFLASDLGLTDDEVACTARSIEDELDGDDLDEVTAGVRRVDEGEVTLDELAPEVSAPILASVRSCAGAS